MAATLLIGTRLLSMSASDLRVFTNPEVIAINQDVLGVQGVPIWSNCPEYEPLNNWWMSPWSMPYDVCCMWTSCLATASAVALATGLLCRGRRMPRCTCFALLVGFVSALYIGVLWIYRPRADECQQVWSRPLADGSHAMCFINFASQPALVVCDEACLSALGSAMGADVQVRDVVRRVDLPLGKLQPLQTRLEADGGSALWRVTPKGV